MSGSYEQQHPQDARHIDRLDFDANRGTTRSNSSRGGRSLLDDDVDFMGEVVGGILELDRRRMRRQVVRTMSFICAILSCLCAGSITTYSLYAPRFITHLRYTQLQVNGISIAGEIGLYLLVPLFGFLCDRYSPAPLALLSSFLFGFGYLLAAFVYRAGPPASSGAPESHGLPQGLMMLAFFAVGAGTSCMYLSGVATCAKNFSTSKYRGLLLSLPIAAFGLSGMWQSQVGAHLLYERLPNGRKGEVDVFRYFLFLGLLLAIVGLVGTFGLRVVDEEALIERGCEELERSGLLHDSEIFDAQNGQGHSYGTVGVNPSDDEVDTEDGSLEPISPKKQREDEGTRLRQKKTWLLNHATSAFLSDGTMWLLAVGFLLVTGPGEAYINNVGTIISTLTPDIWTGPPPAGEISTHVSIIAIASTIARIFTGTMSDIFAPRSGPVPPADSERHRRGDGQLEISRIALLLPSALLLCLGYLTMTLFSLLPAADTDPAFLLATSALVGFGYGACFSLVPIVISTVWDVENFATNWGIVAVMPAPGAAFWSVIYSIGYARATREGNDREGGGDVDRQCHSSQCFTGWAWGCAASVALAALLWGFAWRVWKRRQVVV